MTELFDTSRKSQLALNVLLVLAFLGLNPVLNLTNKWALGIYGFSFPLLLTSCHMAFSCCVLSPFMLREPFKSKHRSTLKKQWKGLVAIGFFFFIFFFFGCKRGTEQFESGVDHVVIKSGHQVGMVLLQLYLSNGL